MGAIYRNGYKYGDGNGVAQNPVLAIKSGNELYEPENGVVDLSDTCKSYAFYVQPEEWESYGEVEIDVTDPYNYIIPTINFFNEIILPYSSDEEYWRKHNIRLESTSRDASTRCLTSITLTCDPDNLPNHMVSFRIVSRACKTGSSYINDLYGPIGIYADSELDSDSVYPVQNKAVAAEINKINAKVPDKIEVSCVKTKINGAIGEALDVEFLGPISFNGYGIWTDGENIYYSSSSTQYVLNKTTSEWSKKTWGGSPSFNGSNIWTDGDNIYCSDTTTTYKLTPKPAIKSVRLR